MDTANICRWFGTREDAVKWISNIVVMADWKAACKATPLAKLMALAGVSVSDLPTVPSGGAGAMETADDTDRSGE